MLKDSRVKIGLLRGGSKESERREFIAQLASGEIHIAVGTHALLEPDVNFKALSLLVVDEQHKFGVEQRMKLREKGTSPHVLVMTATPIPRTLTLTLYGDLDVSRIDQPPPGRGEIITKWVPEVDRPKVYRLIVEEARKGHATYIVLPRINSDEESAEEKAASKPKKKAAPKKLWSEVKGVEAEIKRLREHLPTLRMEMLHGRLQSEEKDRVLNLLREGKIDILVSTQVIEVGIDLPTATVMLIENAEMFGLSALHQLRGRVGRSERKSYCFVFGEAATDDTDERLKTFVKTRDGFEIAEADFRIRGPGQFFGTAQSGMPELKIADLMRDTEILAQARDEAFELVKRDPKLTQAEHAGLRQRVKQVLSGRLEKVDMG
jgi:ATP-dependent DNA helicase RecG